MPFGLRTASRIFNLFTKALHCILASRSTAAIPQYSDDFLVVFTAADVAKSLEYDMMFTAICQELGLEIKIAKNASGTYIVFLRLIIDTGRMEARLPVEKKERALVLISQLAAQKSCTLLDLKRVTGLLNFLSKVVPLGHTFCRRL